MWILKIEGKYSPINVEESTKHFLLSWETCEERRFLLPRLKPHQADSIL